MAARWWRTGDQSEITRMGSPLTFWKLQQAPVLWLLDCAGHGDWIDDPIGHQQELLPLARLGSAWIWLVAFALTIAWSRRSYGPRAMALAAWLFALSPNLIAHGALATMEFPLVAGHDGHVLVILAVPRDQSSVLVLGRGRGGRSGIFVQVHSDPGSPDSGSGLVVVRWQKAETTGSSHSQAQSHFRCWASC